tara:strand:- start:28402 stop:28596 length:195 start_codon:yes stop_codon:yes gene_type:complete
MTVEEKGDLMHLIREEMLVEARALITTIIAREDDKESDKDCADCNSTCDGCDRSGDPDFLWSSK